MNRDSMNALRLDRRLLRRRGWITPEELDEKLQALPDAAAKAESLAVESEPGAAAAAEPPAPGGPERTGGF